MLVTGGIGRVSNQVCLTHGIGRTSRTWRITRQRYVARRLTALILIHFTFQFLQMEPADAESMWSTRTRPILKIGLQPTAPGVREQLTKLIDHVHSEMEDIHFSNHSIEVTMAALETIQQRHPAPAAADNTKAVTLNAQDLEEFLRMKREQVSPGPLSFRDPESGTEDDMEHGGSTTAPEDNNEDQVEMEEDNRVGRTRDTTSTASSQAFTEVSSTGLGDIIPSDDMLSDDSSEGTSIASSGLDFEGPELAATTPDPSGGSLTPTIPTHTAASFRGPVKFPSRQRPMPFALGLVDTPSPSDALTPPVSEGPSHPQPRSSSSSDSSVEATSPVPIVASQTKRTRSKATRQQPASEVIDLTAPTRTMRSAAGGSKHINPAPAGTSTRQNTGSKAASGAARSGGRGVMDITDSPLTSLPSSLAH